jgi:hypothetical protein
MSAALFFVLLVLGSTALAGTVGLIIFAYMAYPKDLAVLVAIFLCLSGLLMVSIPLTLADNPASFTIPVGRPMPVTVEHLTYLTAQFGGVEAVRVDTDHGPIVVTVTPDHPVPDDGRFFLVVRHHAWKAMTRQFLCTSPDAEAFCWPERLKPL